MWVAGQEHAERGRFERHHYQENQEVILELEALLEKHGIKIPVGSPLERLAIDLLKLNDDFFRRVERDPTIDHRADYVVGVGLDDLARKILSVADHPEFPKLVPHLSLMVQDNTGLVQNFFSRKEDDESNKILELYLGTLVLRAGGKNLDTDDPDESSGGKNPDVIATLGSRRWAFAAKMLHSDNPKTYGDLVASGVKQIGRAAVDTGIVVVNFKNQIPLEELWPVEKDGEVIRRQTVYDDWREAVAKLDQFFMDRIYRTLAETWGGNDGIRKYWAENPKSRPAVLNLLPTTVGCGRPEGWAATRINVFKLLPFHDPEPADREVYDALNHAAQHR
jgi:hypothetical protein